ncbi:MAG TPA: zinc-ribbon domain-containing protein [Vicinamibacterales bacterium]|nr:zinc-ribbon domain-containing protein [Vicinamibacterales bacterium]
MKCRSCGAEIAANALICYKCGTATTEAKIKPPSRKSGIGRGTITGLILLGLALAAVAREVACGTLL